MGQIELLYQLQQIDDRLREDTKRLEIVVREQKESQELIDARLRLSAAENGLAEFTSKQRGLNLELESLNDKIKRSNDRLYSGLVKNPKELEDLQNEIESLERRKAILEDQLLETMISVEDAEIESFDASNAYETVENEWSAQQASLEIEQETLVTTIKETSVQRERHLEMIAPEFMNAYENTIRRVGDTAVVALQNNRCRGCLVTVSANQVKAADEGQLITCDSCSRIFCPV